MAQIRVSALAVPRVPSRDVPLFHHEVFAACQERPTDPLVSAG